MAESNAGGDAGVNDTASGKDPSPEGQAASAAAGQDPAELAKRLADAEAEAAHFKDVAARWQAESENSRRRAARDVENAHKFALEKFAADLLPVVDSLEKAVELANRASQEEHAERTGAGAIAEGVALSLKLFRDVLEKSGMTIIDPRGEPFDPQQHEAMAMVEVPGTAPNTVLDVMQKGYALNGRLVRAAMVVVSKGAPAGDGGPRG